MPYQIKKINNHYKLYNIKSKKYVNVNYKTFESAKKAGMNFMRYRKEIPKMVGNKILT